VQQTILEPTAGHPLFSRTRGDWVKAGELRAGEVLQTRTGAAQVVSVTASPGAQRVFNLEVEGEHEYLVGGLEVRSHNGCQTTAPKVTPPNKNPASPSSKKLRQEMHSNNMTVGPDEAAHHIVAGAHKRAKPARDRLKAEGVPVNINSADNGVALPKNTRVPNPHGKAVHSTIHTHEYIDKVNEAIVNASPGKVREVLDDLRRQLEGGGLE
jgi:hypothetical protein